MTTIDERCQELAKQMQLIADGSIRKFDQEYRQYIQKSINELMDDLIRKYSHQKKIIFDIVNFIGSEYFDLDINPVEIEQGTRGFIYYELPETNGFRRARYRPKLISTLSSKIARNFLLNPSEMGEEEKKFVKTIRDAVAFRIIADHPETPAVNFSEFCEAGDAGYLLEFIEENQEAFETADTNLEDYAALAEQGFNPLFNRFKEVYEKKYEKQNEKRLYHLARFIQNSMGSEGIERFSMLNVSDTPMMYKHHLNRLGVASQSFFYIGDTKGERAIHSDIMLFDDEMTAIKYIKDLKERKRSLKPESLRKKDSPHIHQGLFLRDNSRKEQALIVRIQNAVLGFRSGATDKDYFMAEVLGSEEDSGLLGRTLSSDHGFNSAYSLRLSLHEVPVRYLSHHYTDIDTFRQFYGLIESPEKHLVFKDYIKEPRGGVYKALHGIIIESQESEFREPMELQLRTSLQEFEAVRGKAKIDDYEKLKESRVDLSNPDILPDVKGKKRDMLKDFIKKMVPGAIVNYYRTRINKSLKIAENNLGLIEDSSEVENVKRKDTAKKAIDSLVDEATRDYIFLTNEFPRRKFDGLAQRIQSLPYEYIRRNPFASKDTVAYLENMRVALKSRGFDTGSSIREESFIAKIDYTINFFARYVKEKQGTKEHMITCQALALLIDDMGSKTDSHDLRVKRSFSLYNRIISDPQYFREPAVRVKEGRHKPKYSFIPAGLATYPKQKHAGAAEQSVNERLIQEGFDSETRDALSSRIYEIQKELSRKSGKQHVYNLKS